MRFITFILVTIILTGCKNATVNNSIQPPRIEFVPCNDIVSTSFEQLNYLEKKVVIKDDTTIISFGFVKDCCLEFDGIWKIENNILILSYKPSSKEQIPCECKCQYTLRYFFNNKDYSWNAIRIKKGL